MPYRPTGKPSGRPRKILLPLESEIVEGEVVENVAIEPRIERRGAYGHSNKGKSYLEIFGVPNPGDEGEHEAKVARMGQELTHEPIWERQPGEKSSYFSMFIAYAALEPGQRSLANGWKRWSGKDSKRSGAYGNAAATWRWIDRVAAWDAYKAEQQQHKWLTRDLDRREQDYEVGGKLRTKATKALDELGDDDLNDPKIVAQFLALASDLQEKAVPKVQLQPDQIQQVLSSLSLERREIVLKMLVAEIKPN